MLSDLSAITPWSVLLMIKLCMLTWFVLFLLLRMSHFLSCLALTLLNLSCLTFFMKLKCIYLGLPGLLWMLACFCCGYHCLHWPVIVLFMPLTLPGINWCSALSIIFLALALIFCLLLIGLGLMLTGVKFCLKHLRVNILWFLSLTFITFFSHRHNCCKASNPYFSLIFLCMFIILLFNTFYWNFFSFTEHSLLS